MHNYSEIFSLANKNIVIAGGSGQIGFELTTACLQFGANVVVGDINLDRVDSLKNGKYNKNLSINNLDVTSKSSINNFKNLLPETVHGLVNCFHFKGNSLKLEPGNSFFDDVYKYSEQQWDKVHAVNLKGTFFLTQALYDHMISGASVVNFSSTYGLVSPDQTIYSDSRINSPVAYASSKGAIINLTRYMANHFEGIRVNSISPGGVYNNQPKQFVDNYSAKTTLNRMANVTEYAGAIIYLLSNASSYMTGSNLVVDGGWTSK